MNSSNRGSILLLSLGVLVLVSALAFGFLRMVTRLEDTNGPSTRQLMAREAALAGRVHAIEGILRDYGESGLFVRQGDAAAAGGFPAAWTRLPGVRVSRLDGAWRVPMLPPTQPNLSNAMSGAYPIDELTADTRLDEPFTRVWGVGVSDSLGTFDVQPFESGFANTTGRGRMIEVEHYRREASTRLPSPPPRDPDVGPRFSDLATILPDGGMVRGKPMYYDETWRDLQSTGMSAADARRKARYRLRYTAMVEELDSHVPVNATGRDAPHGRDVRETDPDRVTATSPYDPHQPGSILRRIARYGPSIFNLSYASQPHDFGSGPLPLAYGDMIEHVFQGRGMAANVDRDANGFPITWPLMYRRGSLDGQEAADDDPVPNPTRYTVWAANNKDRWGTLAQHLYTDGIMNTVESKLGGGTIKTVGRTWGTKDWNTLWHGLLGRQVSFTNLFIALGANAPGNYHPFRAWSMYFLTPFQRGLELRDPTTPRDPGQRWRADVDTPMHVNLLTATPITIHAMTLAYLPPQAKALRIKSVAYQRDPDPSGLSCTLLYDNPNKPMQFNLPSRDLFVQELWRNGAASAFDYDAPARAAADGTVDPDWHHKDWSGKRGKDHYPGAALCADAPPPSDCALDDSGILVKTDNERWEILTYGQMGDNPAEDFGMRNQGCDTISGRQFIYLPTNYTVTAPALPPGWGASPDMVNGGRPIQDRITQGEWESTEATSTSWGDANGGTHTATGSRGTWSASIVYEGSNGAGAMAGYGKSYWCDMLTAFHCAITVVRAQWTQEGGGCFDPYWTNPGNQLAWSATGNESFRRNSWQPGRYATLADVDRVFLQQLGIDIAAPASARVAPGWNIGRITKMRGFWGARIVPLLAIEEGSWNAGQNLRTLAGNTTADDAGTKGTPRWQRARETASEWDQLVPAIAPADGWHQSKAGRDAYVAAYQADYGLAFRTAVDGTVFSSRLRTAAMEMLLNDWRYSFFGSSPAYAADFRPLDFNGDGLVNCSIYPKDPAALPQEKFCRIDRFVTADAAGRGRAIAPGPGGDTPFCIAGSMFMGKSRFFRIIARGEVWDNVLGRIASSANIDSSVCVDTADRDRPDDLVTAHLLSQRWFFDPMRPAHVQSR
jgi:hypothetical protein